jgi:hypothetical protein
MNLSRLARLGSQIANDGMVFENLTHPRGGYVKEAVSSYGSRIPWAKMERLLIDKTGLNFEKTTSGNWSFLENWDPGFALLVFHAGDNIKFQINLPNNESIEIKREYNGTLDYIELTQEAADVINSHNK